MSDSGTVTAGITVAQNVRRNTKITDMTSATVRSKVNCTSEIEARMVAVRSETMLILISDGIDACSAGIIALMRSTVAMTLAPGVRWIGMMMARCLLYQAAIRLFSGALVAFPTSLTRTGEPFAVGDDQVVIELGLEQLVVGVE